MDISVACPEGFEPDGGVLSAAKEAAKTSGSKVVITRDPAEAATGAFGGLHGRLGQHGTGSVRQKKSISILPAIRLLKS